MSEEKKVSLAQQADNEIAEEEREYLVEAIKDRKRTVRLLKAELKSETERIEKAIAEKKEEVETINDKGIEGLEEINKKSAEKIRPNCGCYATSFPMVFQGADFYRVG